LRIVQLSFKELPSHRTRSKTKPSDQLGTEKGFLFKAILELLRNTGDQP
jgi:hypothetical protein